MVEVASSADVVILQGGFLLHGNPELANIEGLLIADIYDPWLFENLELYEGNGEADLALHRDVSVLNELLDAPEALEYDPLVVRRLRRVRDRRRRARFEGRTVIEPRRLRAELASGLTLGQIVRHHGRTLRGLRRTIQKQLHEQVAQLLQ